MNLPILEFEPDSQWIQDHADADTSTPFAQIARHPALPLLLRRESYNIGDSTGRHRHLDFIALYLVRSGRGFHVIDGQRYALSRGDIYLMAPGAAHAYRDYEALRIDAIYFQPVLFSAEEIAALRSMPDFWRLFVRPDGDETNEASSRRHRSHLTPEMWRRCEAEIEELHREWQRDTPDARALLRAGVFRLLVHLARWREEAARQSPQQTSFGRLAAHVDATHVDATHVDAMHVDEMSPKAAANSLGEVLGAEAVRFCDEHFAEPLSVPMLAARFFVSPGHLSELFVRAAGMPPAAYIRRLRLEKAASLLRETSLPVGHIARQAGFGADEHFNRSFSRAFGLSPLQFRKRRHDLSG